jgi:assimilatory nitrate reductase catalytic subunit
MLLHARGIEQQSKGVDNVLAAINLGLATGKFGKPGCGVTTITGQGNGQGGREHGHKCDQLPGNRDITNPEHRAHVASVWGCDVDEIPGKGIPAQEIIEAIHAGEIKGCCRSASTRWCRHPIRTSPARRSIKLEFYSVIDFFVSESGHHADIVLPGSLHEEDEGTSTSGEGRIIKINAAVEPPGRGPTRLADPRRHRRPPRQRPVLPVHRHRPDLRRAPPRVRRRHRRLPRRDLGAHRGRVRAVLADPRGRPPGHPRLYEGGSSTTPTVERSSTGAVPAARRGRRRRLPGVAHHRPGRQPVPVGHPDPPHRCARRPVPRAAVRDAPAARRTHRRRRRRPRHRHVPAGHDHPARHVVATIRPDTVFIPYHWPGDKAANQLTQPSSTRSRRCPSSRSPPSASNAPAVGSRPPMSATSTCRAGTVSPTSATASTTRRCS